MQFLNSLINPLGGLKRQPAAIDQIRYIEDPDYVVIPLEYPGRIIYNPIIKVGDKVQKNQIVGRSELGHCVHASISGEIKDILLIWTTSIYHVPALLIQRNDASPFTTEQIFEQYGVPFESASNVEKLKALGVISPWTRPGRFYQEAEADFPEIKQLIINGVDEEPTIYINDYLLTNKTEKIISGISIVKNLSPRADIYITVSDYLVKYAQEKFGNSVKVVGTGIDYPDRIERLLIPKTAGTEIPFNVAYRSRGVARISLEFLLKLVDALEGKGPFVSKLLTVAGNGFPQPKMVQFPTGTTIKHLLGKLNLSGSEHHRIVAGGPMTGITQFTELTPLTRTNSGIYLSDSPDDSAIDNLHCMNCGRCTRVCPVNLQVHLIGRYAQFNMLPDAREFKPEACIECGLCSYVCPAHRPLLQFIQMCKKFNGVNHEPNLQIECSDQSTLEKWDNDFQSTATVANCTVAGAGS